MKGYLHIAIDGPVASGKGDIAERLAKKLNLTYLYTGAMYRALAFACINRQISRSDSEGVFRVLQQVKIDLKHDISRPHGYSVSIDGKDISNEIFSPEVAQGASDVGVHAPVRKLMVQKQQQMVVGKSVVMEGRDIGLRVLPNAQLKIFLTATVEERAHRRQLQFEKRGIKKSLAEILRDTQIRDEQDMNRAADPLQKLPDAWELDTTNLNQEEVVDVIVDELKRRKLI